MSLAARVRELRESLGMSQTDLAYRVDVEPSYISQIESGKKRPSIELQEKLAAELRTSLADFLFAAGHNIDPPPIVSVDKMSTTDIHAQVDRLLGELRRRDARRAEVDPSVRRLAHARVAEYAH